MRNAIALACLLALTGCASSSGKIVSMEQDAFQWKNTSFLSKQTVDPRGQFKTSADEMSFSASGKADQDSTAMVAVIDAIAQALVKAAMTYISSGALGGTSISPSVSPPAQPSAPSLLDRLSSVENLLHYLVPNGLPTQLKPIP